MTDHSDISRLPLALLENVLAYCAADGHPQSVAALAQTCRRHRALVYSSSDHHLWRTIFLTTFDDPRAIGQTLSFSWREEFETRIWSSTFMQRNAWPGLPNPEAKGRALHPTLLARWHSSVRKVPRGGEINVHQRALAALLSVIQTIAPAPQQTSLLQYHAEDRPSLTQMHAQTPLCRSLVQPSEDESLNIAWLRTVLGDGLPFAVTNIMLTQDYWDDWKDTALWPALSQLTSYLGFRPISFVDEDDYPPSPSRSLHALGSAPTRGLIPVDIELDVTPEGQRQRVLSCARHYVFNMSYLSRRRNWGPYHLVSRSELDDVTSSEEEAVETDSDTDYVPPEDAASTSSATPEPVQGGHPHAPGSQRVPPADQLYPDWTWLSAARIVAECKLYAEVDVEEIVKLRSWDNLQRGAWSIQPENGGRTSEHPPHLTSEDGLPEAEEYERDWAGVEGMWRRLVCWLDYDDLLDHNMNISRIHLMIEEAWIIVPMCLRITGYSAPSVAAYSNRPTIHIVGEMGGGGWVGNIEAGNEDIRSVHGTVSMLPDGSVRWSITSTAPDSTEDEWASEAVQLGGAGSGMGALGMWTGALHEGEDPLVACWLSAGPLISAVKMLWAEAVGAVTVAVKKTKGHASRSTVAVTVHSQSESSFR